VIRIEASKRKSRLKGGISIPKGRRFLKKKSLALEGEGIGLIEMLAFYHWDRVWA
jgi:hypothetical protein